MNKKKQGSLSSKILKHKTQRSVSREPQQKPSNIRSSSINQTTNELHQFMEHYHILKQQYVFNLTSNHIFEQLKVNQNNDDQFCFDVDLGVPYVESQHLDSGFDFEEKQSETISFPKISSAKEIFTSVLQINDHSANQLEEQNFTDQEEEEQDSIDFSKFAKLNKKSRKQVPTIFGKVQCFKQHQEVKTEKSLLLSCLIQNQFNNCCDKENVMQKLKMTAEFREEKLRFWNERLVELQKSGSTNKNFSIVSQVSHKTLQFNDGQNSFYSINSNLNRESSKNDKNHSKLSVKRSKFEKMPIQKKNSKSKTKTNLIKNKENISPIKQKHQTNKSFNIITKERNTRNQNEKKYLQAIETNQNINPSNSKSYLGKRRENILRNQPASRSKDKNQIKKVF